MSDALDIVLRRDRWIVNVALLAVILGAWGWLLAGAGMDMDAWEMTRHSLMAMPAAPPPPVTLSWALLMFSMWWIMMIAMMLPSAAPTILLASALNRRSTADQAPYGPSAAFTAGYLLAWAGFSLVAVAAQAGLRQAGWLNGMLVSVSPFLSGLLLMVAGAWQFTPWKQACLRHCRSPVEFLTRHRRAGVRGALLMGLRHGAWCLGCCWFLMVLLFVGGVMNLFWIVGLAVYVWLEKQVVAGVALSRVMGVVLTVWGAAWFFRA